MRVWFRQKTNLVISEPHDIPLYNNQGRPLWKEHKELRQKVDVAALNINLPEKFKCYPLNKIEFGNFRVEIGQDVFITGFPRGIDGGLRFPIWKRGSIASEPEIDLDNFPKVLIDSMTKEGMSGAPVIAQYVGYYSENNNPEIPDIDAWFGTERRLLGIYSGRHTGTDEFEAHLGIVWKVPVIESIVQSGVQPE